MEINENKLKEILDDQRKTFQVSTDRALEKNKLEFQHFMGIVKEDLQSQVGLIAEQYQDIKDDLSIIKSDVQFLKSELRQKVSYDEFNALVKRVSLLEAKPRK